MSQLEQICKALHDEYERIALKEGWKTQEASRIGWESLPKANKATMLGAVKAAVMPRIEELERQLADEKAKTKSMFERLNPSVEYVEDQAVGYGEDEIDRLTRQLAQAQKDVERINWIEANVSAIRDIG